MTTFEDLQQFFRDQDFRLILAADAEPVVTHKEKDGFSTHVPAGGVAVALEPIAKAAQAYFVARGKTESDYAVLNNEGEILINPDTDTSYLLKRLFFTEEEVANYYYGFSNQTLWPLSHVAFEQPEFNDRWFEGYKHVNRTYAQAIKENISGKSMVWIHDYQLALVPGFLSRPKNTLVSFFWHIPWPTWEVFRILPQKKQILESLLSTDFLAFHRGYHVRNFFETVDRELEARIDRETNKIYYNNQTTTVAKLPLGIDTDVIKRIVKPEQQDTFVTSLVRALLGIPEETPEKEQSNVDAFFKKNKVILGVDRLDYTKGLQLRMKALDTFFTKYPQYQGNVSYMGILSPSREAIPSYQELKKRVYRLARELNQKYQTSDWKPVHLYSGVFSREEILNLYQKAQVCLVNPLDDGMNLVSKEFVIASSLSSTPGMLVLSQFAGSSIDLTDALIINPYNISEVAEAIRMGLVLPVEERKRKIQHMADVLEERNVYSWAMKFVRRAMEAQEDSRFKI